MITQRRITQCRIRQRRITQSRTAGVTGDEELMIHVPGRSARGPKSLDPQDGR